MMFNKTILTVLLTLITGWALAQTPHARWQPAHIVQAQQTLLSSHITQRRYRIQVLAVGDMPAEGYMPLYVLDGDMMFPTAATAAYSYYHHAKDNGAKPLLVIGIGYDNGQLLDLAQRSLDYTPPIASQNIGRTQAQRGEADLFLQMIQQELKPLLQQQYRLQDAQAALMGHSYGGVLALYALLQHPNDFSHYIISSPSMWWNDGVLQHLPPHYFQPLQASDQRQKVRLSVGEFEQTPSPYIDADGERAQILAHRQMVDKVDAMAQTLRALKRPNTTVQFERYAAETHTGAMFRAVLDGVKFVYH